MTQYKYFSQTGAEDITLHESSNSDVNDSKKDYKFNSNPIIFDDLSPEETISKEDRIKFYKKVFETKSF
ncbi:MAG: hypothetical protein PHW01_00260 [Patescibacteria group bacterium]|nr:hypothetical protein [Patescibacteria group bacterium]